MSIAGDEMIRKLRPALAETGYGNVLMLELGGPMLVYVTGNQVPCDVTWRARSVCGVSQPCWSCWESGDGVWGHWSDRATACTNGDCQAGPTEPKVPPRRIAAGVSSHKGGELK